MATARPSGAPLVGRLAVALVIAAVIGGAWTLRSGASPGGDATVDSLSGAVLTTEGGLDGGRLWFVWEGRKQRIYQPAGLLESDLDTLGLVVGEPAPDRLTLGPEDAAPTRFVVLPADGPGARLYLEQDGTLHRVTLVPVDTAEVEALPDIADPVTTRVRLR